jgi:3-phenylpropionate/trans-cinnamate dioxygenase ferredoxin subunit
MQWYELSSEIIRQLESLKIQQLTTIIFQGKAICITRLEDGFFGIHDVCPHAGAKLHDGNCNKRGVVSCLLHGYKFDIKTGRSTDGNNYKIAAYSFKTEQDKLYIGIK